MVWYGMAEVYGEYGGGSGGMMNVKVLQCVTEVYSEYGGGGGMMNDQGGTPARLLPNGCLPGRVLAN